MINTFYFSMAKIQNRPNEDTSMGTNKKDVYYGVRNNLYV